MKGIFKPSCLGCHNGENEDAGLDLRSYKSLLEYSVDSQKAIKPGKPESSLLYTAIESGYMPPTDEKLRADQIEAVRQWIVDGANEN